MRRSIGIGLIVGAVFGAGAGTAWRSSEAVAQKARGHAQWEYKVGVFSYNPGERLSDKQRAAYFERELNQHASQGWEPVGSLLSRDTVQTVGGAITTRDTTSFVAYRRKR